MGTSQVTELLDFTGGMNTLVAPHLISPRESTALINVDVRLGSLASMPNLEHKGDLTDGAHFYEFESIVHSYPNYRDNVLWDNKWYWSDGLTTQKMLQDGTIMDLGLPTPETPCDIDIVPYPSGFISQGTASVADINDLVPADIQEGWGYTMLDAGDITIGTTPITVAKNDLIWWQTDTFVNLGNDIAGPHTGDFKYCYTFYSQETGVESAPSPLQNEYLTAVANQIEVTNLEPLPEDADRYRIYRIGGYLPAFTLVTTLTEAEYNGSWTDDLGDTRVDGRQLQTMYCGLPPEGLENLTEFNGRFYGSVGNKVYYSALGNPDAWYISDYFITRDTIIGIANSPGGILVIGNYFTMLMYGSQPTDYRIKLLSDQIGCVDKRSISYLGDSAIWLSHRAFIMCNGYTVNDITAHKIDNLRGLIPTGAVVDDSTYYMSFKPALVPLDTLYPAEDLYPNIIDGTAGLDEGIIAMDFKRGNGYSYKLISYPNIHALGMVRGEVHVSTGRAKDGRVECDSVMFPNCFFGFSTCSGFSYNRMSVYNGQGLTKLYYISPRMADGSLATLKQYDKIRVVYTGLFNIKVVFDNGEIAVERDTANLEELEGIITIGIPNNNNLSQFIRVIVEGVGYISSIQYSWKPRELPS